MKSREGVAELVAQDALTLAIPSVSVSRVMIAQIFRSAGQSALARARTVSPQLLQRLGVRRDEGQVGVLTPVGRRLGQRVQRVEVTELPLQRRAVGASASPARSPRSQPLRSAGRTCATAARSTASRRAGGSSVARSRAPQSTASTRWMRR